MAAAASIACCARSEALRARARAWRASFGPARKKLRYVNSNRLVRARGWPIRLQKTGYIVEAGQCLALVTRVRGRDVVMVLLDAGSAASRGADAGKLRRWVSAQLAAR